MDVAKINELLDKRVRDLARTGGTVPDSERPKALREALGLEPLPPRTELRASVEGTLEGDGYRVEKIRYEARPGELVTAHLYLPTGIGPFPIILSPHGHWEFKKSTPHVQSRGISLALEGFACFVIDSPGWSWDKNEANEREGMGPHEDWFASMGAPLQGIYVWDILRGLDYLETRGECDASKVGITGSSGGGTASMYAFAVDARIQCAVPVCSMASFETATTDGCLCNHVPGVLNLGDRSDLLGMRAPAPVLIIGATVDADFPEDATQRTYEKMRRAFKENVRLTVIEGEHDYSRRMRESMVAFFREVLMGDPVRGFKAEIRPLTDSLTNPYPANTLPPLDPELWVLSPDQRATITMRDMLYTALAEPYPAPYDAKARLIPWGRYGRVGGVQTGAVLAIHDDSIETPREPNSIPLPTTALNQRQAIYLGLSPAEVLAQMLHLALPGIPTDHEASTAASSLTSIVASVKNIVGVAEADPPKMVVAEGPLSSFVAHLLKLYRPELEMEVSHQFSSWQELLETNVPSLSQPGARYLAFPA